MPAKSRWDLIRVLKGLRHKKRTVFSFDSNFLPHTDWFAAQKITPTIKSGLQEAFSRISQAIYSRVSKRYNFSAENCQDMCQQRNFQQNHLRIYSLPIYAKTLHRPQMTKIKTGYSKKYLINQKLPVKIFLLHIGLLIYGRAVVFLT